MRLLIEPRNHLSQKPQGGYETHPGRKRDCVLCRERALHGWRLAFVILAFTIFVLVTIWMIVHTGGPSAAG